MWGPTESVWRLFFALSAVVAFLAGSGFAVLIGWLL